MKKLTGIVTLLLCTCLAFSALAQGQNPPPRNGDRPPARNGEKPPKKDGGGQYTLEQAISDRAQLNTIAFSGLAFLTGSFGCDTFLPPGKVSDFFGFQYIRDVQQKGMEIGRAHV